MTDLQTAGRNHLARGNPNLAALGQPYRFKPGNNANPNGATAYGKFSALIRQHCPEAVETLLGIMRDRKAGYAIRAQVAFGLITHGYGKPKERMEVTSPDGSMSPGAAMLTAADREQRLIAILESAFNSASDAANGKPVSPPLLEANITDVTDEAAKSGDPLDNLPSSSIEAPEINPPRKSRFNLQPR